MNDKHLSEMLSHLHFSLFAGICFVHVLHALSRNNITFFFSVISFKVTRCQTVDTVFLKKCKRILNQKLKKDSVQKSDAVMA